MCVVYYESRMSLKVWMSHLVTTESDLKHICLIF